MKKAYQPGGQDVDAGRMSKVGKRSKKRKLDEDQDSSNTS